MKTTIGGDRLGAGNKQEVSMKTYSRSSHDVGYTWRSSVSAGTLVPFMSELALPGDNWDIDLSCEVLTLPTRGPLFGSFKVQLDVFQVPIRLYQARLHMNELGIGMEMDNIKLPSLRLRALWQTAQDAADTLMNRPQVHPSNLLRYLGIAGVGRPSDPDTYNGDLYRRFNAVPYLGYFDIFKNYYSNKQEDNAYQIDVASGGGIPTIGAKLFLINGAIADVYNKPYSTDGSNVTKLEVYFQVAADRPTSALNAVLDGGVLTVISTLFTNSNWDNDKRAWVFDTPTGAGSSPWGSTLYVPTQTGALANPDDTDRIALKPFPLKNIDDMRKSILRHADDTTTFSIDTSSPEPYKYFTNVVTNPNGANLFSCQFNQGGLLLKTYQSDLFNNWISTEWIDGPQGVNEITKVDTSGDSFTIDALNLAQKVYIMLNRIAISGGTYDDWLDAVYTHQRRKGMESPMYLGSLIKELSFQEVVSNSEFQNPSDGNLQPLGTLAGRGRLTDKHKGGKVKVRVDEPSYILGIVSLTPRVDYSQGNKWDMTLETLNDLHKPALDAIGYQDLITDQMHFGDTVFSDSTTFTYSSAGKVPAWINYMTSVNKCYGNFADEAKEMYMTLNRKYELDKSSGITDLTTYIDPAKFNFIFAYTDLAAQNFWVQIGNRITARRKMSAKVIPNL